MLSILLGLETGDFFTDTLLAEFMSAAEYFPDPRATVKGIVVLAWKADLLTELRESKSGQLCQIKTDQSVIITLYSFII